MKTIRSFRSTDGRMVFLFCASAVLMDYASEETAYMHGTLERLNSGLFRYLHPRGIIAVMLCSSHQIR